ncbi:MAG TPA: MBL fold metallo-hydrolase [Gemmatimonadales bacterium]|nr:MBL fold metallo-hydrolase [Gemmatimonadales bacterium]
MHAHYDGTRFFNPGAAPAQPVWMVPRLLLTRRARWPKSVPVQQRVPPGRTGIHEVIVTFVGHSTFLVQTPAGNVLIDPVYARRASPVQFAGPRRARLPGVRFTDLPEIDVVLISHNHYDHCDLHTIRALQHRFGPRFVTALGNAALLKSAGAARVEELDWWQEAESLRPLAVQLTPARHFSARGIFDRDRALWGGFLIHAGDTEIFFAGDSGYGPHFGEIRERSRPIDLALLPIGAYEPRWFMRPIHMNPAEAVQAHVDLGARHSLAMHFGTFQLTPEAIDAPERALSAALSARAIPATDFRAPECGESLRLVSRSG